MATHSSKWKFLLISSESALPVAALLDEIFPGCIKTYIQPGKISRKASDVILFDGEPAIDIHLRLHTIYPGKPVIYLSRSNASALLHNTNNFHPEVIPADEMSAWNLRTIITGAQARIKAREALDENLERYDLLTKATNNIVWDWEITKKHAYWVGSGLSSILGYDQDEMLVKTDFWETNLHPEDKDRVIQRLENIFKEAKLSRWEDEYRLQHRDGTYRTIYDRGFIIYKNNLPVRMIGSMENITPRKDAEEAILHSEENYKQLFDYNPLATFIWDTETFQIVEANKTAIDEYGYSRREFLKLKVTDLRTPEEAKIFKATSKKILKGSTMRHEAVWSHVKKNGERMLMQVTSYRITYQQRSAILALAKNVTEKTALEKKLEHEKKIKQQLITEAVISAQEKERTEIGKELHDNVNQLLSASRLYIEAAKSEPDRGPDLLTQASGYIMNAIEEIRVLSKALNSPLITEHGLLESVQNLVDDIMNVHPLHIELSKVGFREDGLAENFKLTMFRIIQEKVTNILKHSDATDAGINLERTRNLIILEIFDNGKGFNVKEKRKGIGLRNIESRAALYNGKTKVESAPGKGTFMRLEFPVKEALQERSGKD